MGGPSKFRQGVRQCFLLFVCFVPVFLRNSIAVCDFPGGGGGVRTPCQSPLDPPMWPGCNFKLSYKYDLK